MAKIDLTKECKGCYTASVKKPALVDVPKLKFLTYDGSGHPEESPVFPLGFEALYSVAYTLKFAIKAGPGAQDFKVMPPEGVWWVEGGKPFEEASKNEWRWRLMMAIPDYIDAAMVRDARQSVKKKNGLAAVDAIRLKTFREGKCVQMMHVGPYEKETETITKLKADAEKCGFVFNGPHHEIYFSDP